MHITLLAHAGHGTTEGGTILHQVTEPLHLSFLLAGVVIVWGVAWFVRHQANVQLERAKQYRH